MIHALIQKKEEVLSLYVFAFLIPLNPKWYGFALLLISLESIWKYKTLIKVELKDLVSWKNPIAWLLVYYLLHWIGLLNTTNTKFALQDLGMKSTFAILPLYFLILRPQVNLNLLFHSLLLGGAFSVLIYLIYSLINLNELGSLNYGIDFSFWMHRGYYTTYLALGFTFLFIQIFRKSKISLVQILVMFLLIIGFYFAEAKAAILTIVLIGLLIFLTFIKTKLGWIKFSISLFVLVIMLWIAVPFILSGRNRFADAFIYAHQNELDVTSIESTTARILLWESSIELIQENVLFGVGTGDVKDVLQKRNFEKGYTGVAEGNYNSHNQFLNSWLSLGVFGFLSLLAIFVTLCLKRQYENMAMIRYAVFIFLLFILTESFLETQAGIIPFAFFVSCIGISNLKPDLNT